MIDKNQHIIFTNKSVLLVEDNEMNILFTTTILDKWEMLYHIARNGQEALDLMAKHSVDLILMDLEMPIMDGFLATKGIRGLPNKKKLTPIVALSGTQDAAQIKKIQVAGMNDFIAKPFTSNQLYSAIAKYLNPENLVEPFSSYKFNSQLDHSFLLEIYGDDLSYAYTMFDIFISSIDTEFKTLQNCINTEDMEMIKKQIHKMKPTFSMVGLTDLFNRMQQLEDGIGIQNQKDSLAEMEVFKQRFLHFLPLIIKEKKNLKKHIPT